MRMRRIFVTLMLTSALGGSSGCALLTKSSPIVPRYFDPETEPSAGEIAEAPEPSQQMRLRLGRVEAGPHLRERMVYRTSETEVGYYSDRRWTERPAAYVRRALSYSLFEHHGITRVVSGQAPNLDAELVAFEELQGSEHRVRVTIVMTLEDATGGALDQTVTVEEPVAEGSDEKDDAEGGDKDDAASVVRAFSTALSRAVEQVSQVVLKRLERVSVEPQPSAPSGRLEAPPR